MTHTNIGLLLMLYKVFVAVARPKCLGDQGALISDLTHWREAINPSPLGQS